LKIEYKENRQLNRLDLWDSLRLFEEKRLPTKEIDPIYGVSDYDRSYFWSNFAALETPRRNPKSLPLARIRSGKSNKPAQEPNGYRKSLPHSLITIV